MRRRVASAARRARQRMRAITPSAAATVAHAKRRCMTPISIVFPRRLHVASPRPAPGLVASDPPPPRLRTAARSRGTARLRGQRPLRPPSVATSNPCPGRNRVLGGMFQPGLRAWARRGDDDHGVETAPDARRPPKGRAIEADTPNGAFPIAPPGYYRIAVDQARTPFTPRRGGEATLVPANGEATDVAPDQQVVLEGSDTPQLATNAAP